MIRIGLIGTGNICVAHLNYLKSRTDVEITALCDINPANLERRCKEFGGEPFTGFEEMLAKKKLDAVYLCTPSRIRREPLIACAERRIPVFCEKPVERTLKRAETLARELRKLKARVQVGYVFRSMPVIGELRRATQGDTIYAVQSFYSCPMSLSRTAPAWFFDKKASGGALVDQATHNLDLLRHEFGEVREVRGTASNPLQKKTPGYTIEETIALSLLFANGMVASHVHTWIGDKWRNQMVFSGRKRFYRIDLVKGSLSIEAGNRTRSFCQGNATIYAYENAKFVEQVISGDWSGNPADYADGLATLRLTLACDQAVARGQTRPGT